MRVSICTCIRLYEYVRIHTCIIYIYIHAYICTSIQIDGMVHIHMCVSVCV
jgi:hypothetical protein